MTGALATPVALTGTDQQVHSGRGGYVGFAVRETAAAAAVVRIYDGTSAAGVLLDQVTLAANGEARAHYPGGLRFATGLFVDVVSGAVAGSIRIA
jgi:hypothetical protein